MQRVYLDNAATTQVLPEVVEAMLPYYTTCYGNPSGFHSFSREAHKGLDAARRTVASCLNAADPSEITFTGGGSEARQKRIAKRESTSSRPRSSTTRSCIRSPLWKRRGSPRSPIFRSTHTDV